MPEQTLRDRLIDRSSRCLLYERRCEQGEPDRYLATPPVDKLTKATRALVEGHHSERGQALAWATVLVVGEFHAALPFASAGSNSR